MSKIVTVEVVETKEIPSVNKDRLRIVENLITYYQIEELAEHGKISERTLYRTIKEKIPRGEENRFTYTLGANKFYSPRLFFLTKKNKKRLLNLPYARMLSAYTWDYSFTIGFKYDYNVVECRGKIDSFIKHLKIKISQAPLESKKMLIFYALEKYAGRQGYHIHGAMGFFSADTKTFGKRTFEKFYSSRKFDRLIEEHNNRGYWGEYIVKHISRNEDGYDFEFINIPTHFPCPEYASPPPWRGVER